MNNYYQLAAQYFQRFEKAEFFPQFKDKRVLLFCFFSAIFLVTVYLVFASDNEFVPSWLLKVALFGSEGAAILAAYAILSHKTKTMAASLPSGGDDDVDQKIQRARQTALVEITGKPPSEFLDLLQDIKKLQVLEQEHRSRLDPEFWKSLIAFLTHPFWPRLLSGLLILVGVLFGKPEKLLDINLAEILNNTHTVAKLWGLLQLSVAGLFLGFLLFLLTRQLLELVAILFFTKWPSKQGNTTMLNYFMRDLIKYYAPEQKTSLTENHPEQPKQQQPTSEPKPYNGMVVAAMALQAAYTCWQSIKRRPPK